MEEFVYKVTSEDILPENKAETIRAFIKWVNQLSPISQGTSLRICVAEEIGTSSELV